MGGALAVGLGQKSPRDPGAKLSEPGERYIVGLKNTEREKNKSIQTDIV